MSGAREFDVDALTPGAIGDIVELHGRQIRVLTPQRVAASSPARSAPRTKNMTRTLDPRRLKGTAMRERVEREIHAYFHSQAFTHTRTPLLVPCPGMETHIRVFKTVTGEYLPTSPEFAMKRLLVGGLERIYQICPAFRLEPHSRTHSPEFTMLEWYRAYSPYESIMDDVESMIERLAHEILGKPSIAYQGRSIDVTRPWPRLSISDLFLEHAQVDLRSNPDRETMAAHCKRLGITVQPSDLWDDLYFRIWLNVVEDRLPQDRACIVYGYPPSQAALSVIETLPSGYRQARRFEVYAGGLELGNAFEELTDPKEQRERFIKDMATRAEQYGESFPPSPIDEGFIEALEEGMPPSAGIAMGVDRLIMLLADETDIDYTFWIPAFSAEGAGSTTAD